METIPIIERAPAPRKRIDWRSWAWGAIVSSPIWITLGYLWAWGAMGGRIF